MTLLFIIFWLVLTGGFCIVNSMYVGSSLPAICYGLLTGCLTAGFALYEKKRRQRLLSDVRRSLRAGTFLPLRRVRLLPWPGSSG